MSVPKALLRYLLRLLEWAWPIRDCILIHLINKLVKTSRSMFKQRDISILDLGCGTGITSIRLVYKSILKQYIRYLVGLDIDIKKLYKAKILLEDIVLGDASNLHFRSRSFDLIFMIEVLDHLPKLNGLRLLTDLDNLCRVGIIITCPNGYLRSQVPESHMSHVWDRHNSDWYPEELIKFGYNVITIVPKTFMNMLTRFRVKRPFLLLQLILPFISLINLPPHVGSQIIAWKRKGM